MGKHLRLKLLVSVNLCKKDIKDHLNIANRRQMAFLGSGTNRSISTLLRLSACKALITLIDRHI